MKDRITISPAPGHLVQLGSGDIGKIAELRDEPPATAMVEFADGSKKLVSLESTSVRLLNEDGFLVATTRRPSELRRMVREKPDEVIRLVLQDSSSLTLETEEIRRQLVPEWISEQDWEKWWKRTREMLKRHPEFDTSQARRQIYALHSEQRRRQDELLGRLSGATESPSERISYLKELLEFHQREALSDEELVSVRAQVLSLAEFTPEETWIKVQALILAAEFGWIDENQFRKSMNPLAMQVIRWRPITKQEHFQMAQGAFLGLLTRDEPIPPGVWSGLLAIPRLGRWAAAQIMTLCPDSQVEQAIALATAAAFPPRPPLNAEPEWILDLVEVLDEIRNDWRMFDPHASLNWHRVAKALLDSISELRPSDLDKKRVARVAVKLIQTSMRWLPGTANQRVSEVIGVLREGEGFSYQVPLVAEVLLTSDDEDVTAALADQLATQHESSTLWHILNRSDRLPVKSQLALLEDLAGVATARLAGLPRLTELMLGRCTQIADAIELCEIPRLLAVVQKVSAAQKDVHRSTATLETRLWHDLLLTTGSEVWPGADDRYRLGSAFRDAIMSLLNEAREEADVQTRQVRQERDKLAQGLAEARGDLAEARARIDQIARLRDSQTRNGPSREPDSILRGLAGAVAEVERAAARQGLRPEAAGQLLMARLQRLLRQAGLTPIGSLGQLEIFDSTQHEIVEGKLGPNRQVQILETGFSQSGSDGTRVLVKPALVRATGV